MVRQHHFTPSVRHHHPFRTSRNLFAELDGPHLSIPTHEILLGRTERMAILHPILPGQGADLRAKEQTKKYRFFGESLTWIFAGLSLLTILVSLLSFLVYISNAKVVSGASELSWFRILIYVFSILIYVVALLSCVFLLMYSIIGLKRSWSTEAFNDYHDRWKSIDTDISIGITLDQVLEQVSSLKKCEENNQMRA